MRAEIEQLNQASMADLNDEDAYWNALPVKPSIPMPVGEMSHANAADFYLDYRRYKEGGLRLRYYKGNWMRYDGGVYRTFPDEELVADITGLLRETPNRNRVTAHYVNNVVGHLKAVCIITSDYDLPVLDTQIGPLHQRDWLVVHNGVLDLAALLRGETHGSLNRHTPALVSTVKLPFSYDRDAQCPRWGDFLKQVLPDEDSRNVLQEIFGYCLTYDTTLHRFFVLQGTGANGKSVVLDVLERLLGGANVSHVPLERFGDAHDLVSSCGKLVKLRPSSAM